MRHLLVYGRKMVSGGPSRNPSRAVKNVYGVTHFQDSPSYVNKQIGNPRCVWDDPKCHRLDKDGNPILTTRSPAERAAYHTETRFDLHYNKEQTEKLVALPRPVADHLIEHKFKGYHQYKDTFYNPETGGIVISMQKSRLSGWVQPPLIDLSRLYRGFGSPDNRCH